MINVQQVAHHRNGVMGCPFYVVTFTEEEDAKTRNMVGVVFAGEGCHVAVFDRDLIGAGVIEFGVNSWRGDRYERWLLDAIDEFNRELEAGITKDATTEEKETEV